MEISFLGYPSGKTLVAARTDNAGEVLDIGLLEEPPMASPHQIDRERTRVETAELPFRLPIRQIRISIALTAESQRDTAIVRARHKLFMQIQQRHLMARLAQLDRHSEGDQRGLAIAADKQRAGKSQLADLIRVIRP